MRFVSIKDDTAVISVPGIFRYRGCPQLQADVETAKQNGCTKALVDFTGTTYIDSATLKYLCQVRSEFHPENFSAKGATGKVLGILKEAHLDDWLTV